ncbi:MAG: DUF1648 domain-containing protein [Candidatus Latescibacterota bacterium]
MSESDEDSRFRFIKTLNRVGLLLILILFVLPIVFWSSLPNRIPQRFNFFGEVVAWGGKEVLFFIPVASLILYGFISFVIDSSISRYPETIVEGKSERRYAIAGTFLTLLKVWMAAISTYIEWMIIKIGLRNARGLGRWFGVVVVGTFAVMIVIHLVKAIRVR